MTSLNKKGFGECDGSVAKMNNIKFLKMCLLNLTRKG